MNSSSYEDWLKVFPVSEKLIYLSVIVPAYNEERRLPPTLIEMIDYLDEQKYSYEIIVVDDGSTDQTSQVVEKFEKIRSQVRLIKLAKNRGKGHAVKTGALNAKGQFILFNDADGSTPISEVSKLLFTIKDAKADITFGSRAKQNGNTEIKAHFHRVIIGRTFNLLVNLLLIKGVKDTQCGFKLFTKEAAREVFTRQTIEGFNFDVELLYLAKINDFKFTEVPVNWHSTPGSKVNLITDSLIMFFTLFVIKYRHRARQSLISIICPK